jgi:hypothetical protein
MIHKVTEFSDKAAVRLNYTLGGDHEHNVESIQFIPGTMMSEPVPLDSFLLVSEESAPEEVPPQSLEEICRKVDDRIASRDSSAATGGNPHVTGGKTAANGSQDKEPKRKKNKPLAYDWTDLNDEFEAAASFHNGKGEKLFGHYIIRLAPGETLTNHQWGEVLADYMSAMGYDEFCKFCGFIHNDDGKSQHMHILTCRVKMEHGGPLVNDSNAYEKGMKCMRRLEIKYGLRIVANPEDTWGMEIKKGDFKYYGGDRETVLHNQINGPKKDWAAVIRAKVKQTWTDGKPRDMAELVEKLNAHGVDIQIRTNKQGVPEGINYKTHGSDAWISGSKVMAKRLTWQNLLKQGIEYHPAKHNQALGIPEPADQGYLRMDAYQELSPIQLMAIKKTKKRVRIYRHERKHYAGFGFDHVFMTGRERYDEMMNDILFKLVMDIIALLFGTDKGRAPRPIIMEDGQRPEGFEVIRDDVGNGGWDIAEPKGNNFKPLELKSIKKDVSDTIMDEHGEWIRPGFTTKDSTLDNDMDLTA